MKHLLVFLLLLCAASVSAQDVIVKKDGSTIVCRVVELTSSEIVYKKWSDLNGSNYVMNRTDASAINYQNGKKVNLSETTNLYQPHNQNDGVQQYNDRALLLMDTDMNSYLKKAKTYQYIGIIGGLALIGTGVVLIAVDGKSSATGKADNGVVIPAIACMGAGVVGGVTCLLIANHYRKQGDMLQSASIWHHVIKFSKGSSLMTGVDVLKDNYFQQNTLGLGLRYNF